MAEFRPRWADADETDEAFAQRYAEARRRGDQRLETEPRAVAASYDRERRQVTITLQNGLNLGIPLAALHEIAGAKDDDLSAVCIADSGFALEWPDLDMHMSVAGLLIDLMGDAWLREIRTEMNRRLARSKSAARTQASRENGKKGGRPRKERTA